MKYIAVLISRFEEVQLGIPLHKIKLNSFIQFNKKEANLIGVERCLEYNEVRFYFTHTEFPIVPPFAMCRMLRLEEARKEYPYLFVDTNPLLYRKFR